MKLIKAFWNKLISPSHAALGIVLFLGFAGGLIFWFSFSSSMAVTNTEEFCAGCHAPIAEEIKETIHYANRSGMHVICSDCHVPHSWPEKMARKLQASKELYAHTILKTIDTPEKFNAKRRFLADREWKRLESNDSQECRDCHNIDYMDVSEQAERSAQQHEKYLLTGEKTCIDCHKGIAHELPDMYGLE